MRASVGEGGRSVDGVDRGRAAAIGTTSLIARSRAAAVMSRNILSGSRRRVVDRRDERWVERKGIEMENEKKAIATCSNCGHEYEHRLVPISRFEDETEKHVTTCPRCGLRMIANEVCREPSWS